MNFDWRDVYHRDRDHPQYLLCGPRIRPDNGQRKPMTARERRRREAAEIGQLRQHLRQSRGTVLRVHSVAA